MSAFRHWLWPIVAAATLAASPAHADGPPTHAPAELVPWRYEVEAGPASRVLTVTATFGGVRPGLLTVVKAAQSFVGGVQQRTERGFVPLRAERGGWTLAACPASGCAVRYEFLLAKAADALDDPDVVAEQAGVYIGSASTWLLAPDTGAAGQPVELHVTPAPGQAFATGLYPGGAPGVVVTTAAHLGDLPMALFGPLRMHQIRREGGSVQLAIGAGPLPVPEPVVVAWAERAATAVTAYYGRFPVAHALVYVRPTSHGDDPGRTMGDGGAAIVVPIRSTATAEELDDDWVLTHEMVHLAMPSLPRRHHWLEEGLATYVEPIARIRAGYLTPTRVFHDLIQGLPNGLPDRGDRGLDRTPTWGRTYWGGALFCFLADVQLRQRSAGRVGLEAALRGILAAGGSIADDWDIDRVLAVGDRATGYPVLRELYDRMKDQPAPVDLEALWGQLGVAFAGGRMAFDDKAPLAFVRRAIVAGQASPR